MYKEIAFFLLLACSFDSSLGDSEVCGGNVDIADHPYHLAFLIQGTYHCSATLLSEKYALVPVRCLNRLPSDFTLAVRAGSTNILSGGEVRIVESYRGHPNWLQFDYDVAILTLAEPFVLGPTIQPVKLPEFGEVLSVGDETTVTTWPVTTGIGADSSLEKLSIPILEPEVCDEIYLPHLMTERIYCAGRVDGGNETCKFNVGSPMVRDGILVGIGTLSYATNRPDYPSGYTKIGLVRDWIYSYTGL